MPDTTNIIHLVEKALDWCSPIHGVNASKAKEFAGQAVPSLKAAIARCDSSIPHVERDLMNAQDYLSGIQNSTNTEDPRNRAQLVKTGGTRLVSALESALDKLYILRLGA